MLKNERNLSKAKNLCHYCKTLPRNKNAMREVKHGIKRQEESEWRKNDIYDYSWDQAKRGEVWELKHAGEFGLWVCLDPGCNGGSWKSWDGRWLLLEDEDLEAITQGKFTGLIVSLDSHIS